MNKEEALKGQEVGMDVRRETLELLQKKGPKLDKVLLRLRQALNAKETKFFAHQGEVVEERNVISHNIRLRAVDLALQLHDAMPSQKHEVTGKDGKELFPALTSEERLQLQQIKFGLNK